MGWLDGFWARIDASAGVDGCWLWQGPLEHGYGKLSLGRPEGRAVNEYAHRLAYILEHREPLPPGTRRTIDHLCRVRACVNPAHLELVTSRENLLRSMHRAAECGRRQACMRGHPFSEWNTFRRPNGWRYCRACEYENGRRRKGYLKRRGRYGPRDAR